MEFASSLKVVGWFIQMLFDNCLTATVEHLGVITDKPDLNEALQSLLEKLNSVQATLSVAQNFGGQHKGLLEFLKDLMDAAYDADDLLSEVDYYRLEQLVNDSEDVDDRLQKERASSTPPSFHDINKGDIVRRIHEIVSGLKRLVTCLRKDLSKLEPEEGLCANPNVFPVATHPLTTSFLLPNEKRFSPSLYHGNHLEVLAENEFLAMFNKCAFDAEDPSDHLELDEIAKQIARKLNGSSLAAGIVGGLLRDDLDEQHWRSVLCSDIWQQRRSADDIIPILRFSYHHLPAHLQQCFAYCGVFPKDWKFEKDNLVGMWISQGYIHTKSAGNMSPEEIGSEYFDHLVSKSFIEVSNRDTRNTYALHPLLHDLAESVSEDECLIIYSNITEKNTSRVRHIHARVGYLSLLRSFNLKNLRTLIIDGDIHYSDMNDLKEVLNGLKSIRVLCVSTLAVYLSGSMEKLIHLRYLTVKASYRYMRPDSQCRPYHLQWLIFEAALVDDKSRTDFVLPAAMNCLVSLRHIVSLEGVRTGIEEMSGIGKLTHIQKLKSFKVGKEEGRKLGELKRLNELRGTLELFSIQNASTKEEALEANLNKKIGIRELTLGWSNTKTREQVAKHWYVSPAPPPMAEEVLEGLRPPPYIKELTLDSYTGVKSPSWMVTGKHCLSYLQYLCLQYCVYWKVLPTLGELPSLRHLKIHRADSVEEIGSSFYGAGVAKPFPCLDALELVDMKELVVWSGWVVSSGGKEECPAFPRLRELIVNSCPELKQVPIQHMATVEVLRTNSLLLLKELENLTSIRVLFIERCPKVVSLELKSLTSLENLYISDCNRIQSVPLLPTTLKQLHISRLEMVTAFSMEQEENLSDLTSLREVYIYDCPNLRSLPIMPASLQKLSIPDRVSRRKFIRDRASLIRDRVSRRVIQEVTSRRTFIRDRASPQMSSIEDCPGLGRARYQEGGDDWHKISHVPTIRWLEREDD